MRTVLSLILVLLTFVAPTALAKDLTADQLREIQAKMKGDDTLTVDFVQTRVTGLRGKMIKRDGRAVFVKPNLFKWMLETPKKEFKIYDGKYFYDYSPDTNSAVRISPSGPQAAELRQIIDLVLNFDTLLRRYDLVKADQTGSKVDVQLKPKTEGDITAVELVLDTDQDFVARLKMTLRNKSVLTHDFRNPSRKPVSEDAFQLPKGVRITDSN